MLKKSASGVLASLRGSTYRSVRLASSLAAALLDGLFEHPAGVFSRCTIRANHRSSRVQKQFFRSLLDLPLDHESRKSADHKQEAEKVRRLRSRIA